MLRRGGYRSFHPNVIFLLGEQNSSLQLAGDDSQDYYDMEDSLDQFIRGKSRWVKVAQNRDDWGAFKSVFVRKEQCPGPEV